LTVASSGIASLLLLGGRTAHSKFKIPVPTLEHSVCDITKGSELSNLMKLANLIIWDEAPMAHKYCFETLDRTLKDIMREKNKTDSIFGGKVVVFGGDFRQILPVIPRGSRSDIVHATINSSYLWDQCQIMNLTKNMRLLQNGLQQSTIAEIEEFSSWIIKIGNGALNEPNDGLVDIEISSELLISEYNDPIQAIVNSTYLGLMQKYKDEGFLISRAILASRIETVDEINQSVLESIPGQALFIINNLLNHH